MTPASSPARKSRVSTLKLFFFGPADVHAEEHLDPVLSFGAAGAGVEGDDGVVGVVFAGEHEGKFKVFDVFAQGAYGGGDFGVDAFVVFVHAQLPQGGGVVVAAGEVGVLADVVFEAGEVLHGFLGGGRVVPEAGGGHFFFEGGYLALFVGDVKERP